MLYKYVTFERISILQDGLIRLTQPGDFNDPFELHPSFDLMSRADIALLPDAPETDSSGRKMKILTPQAILQMISAFQQALLPEEREFSDNKVAQTIDSNKIARNNFDRKYGILSLSAIHDDLLMWAHYADHHRGFVIQFDETHPFFLGDEIVPGLARLGKVEYNDTRPVLSTSTLENPAVFLRKSKEWSYENEVRLIRPLSESEEVREGGKYPIHLFKIPFDAIKGIILGAEMLYECNIQIVDLIGSNTQLSHIAIYSMTLDYDKYKININPPLDGKVDQDAINGRAVSARDLLI